MHQEKDEGLKRDKSKLDQNNENEIDEMQQKLAQFLFDNIYSRSSI